MNEEPIKPALRKSLMTRWEAVAVWLYIPIHFVLLPMPLAGLMTDGTLTEAMANLILYAVGFVYMLVFLGRFLRRDFDNVCDAPLATVYGVALSFVTLFAANVVMGLLLSAFGFGENPNNGAVAQIAAVDRGTMTAAAVFLAPVVEELIFRAGIFGTLRRFNVKLAYIISILLFSLYHVVGYTALDTSAWVYAVQYIPATVILCRCYERHESIWPPIFLHMLINGLSMSVL